MAVDPVCELLQKRAGHVDKLEAMLKAAVDEEGNARDFNQREDREFEAAKASIEGIDREIASVKAEQARKAAAAVPYVQHPSDRPPGSSAPGEFSLARLIAGAAGLLEDTPPELVECRSLTMREGMAKGLRIPLHLPDARRMKGQTVGSAPAGGFLVPDYQSAQLVDRLTAGSLIAKLPLSGITAPPGTGAYQIPRVASGTSGNWVGEGQPAPESEMAFNMLQLTPRQAVIRASFSRMLLATSTPSVESIVTRDMSTALSETIDAALLSGPGTGNAPKGILSQGVALAEADYANLWAALAGAAKAIEDANVDPASIRWLVGPGTAERLRTSFKADGADATDGQFIATDPAGLMGYPVVVSTFCPAQTAVLCAWNDVILSQWGSADLLIDPYTQAEIGMIRVLLYMLVDVALRHQESLVKLTLSS